MTDATWSTHASCFVKPQDARSVCQKKRHVLLCSSINQIKIAPVVCLRPFVRASCAVRSHYFLRAPATLNTAARCCCRCVAATWNPRLKHHLQTAARVQPTVSNLCCSRIEMCCPAQALTNLSVGTTEKTFYLNSYLKLIRSLVGTSTTIIICRNSRARAEPTGRFQRREEYGTAPIRTGADARPFSTRVQVRRGIFVSTALRWSPLWGPGTSDNYA